MISLPEFLDFSHLLGSEPVVAIVFFAFWLGNPVNNLRSEFGGLSLSKLILPFYWPTTIKLPRRTTDVECGGAFLPSAGSQTDSGILRKSVLTDRLELS